MGRENSDCPQLMPPLEHIEAIVGDFRIEAMMADRAYYSSGNLCPSR